MFQEIQFKYQLPNGSFSACTTALYDNFQEVYNKAKTFKGWKDGKLVEAFTYYKGKGHFHKIYFDISKIKD